MLTILFSVVSKDLRNKRMMDANLQTNSRQWSKRLDMDEMCAKAEVGMAGEGLNVRGRERGKSVHQM